MFLNNLLLSKEAKHTLALLNKIKIEIEDALKGYEVFGSAPGIVAAMTEHLKKVVQKNSKEITKALRLGKTTSAFFIYKTLNTKASNQITTGDNHSYRGFLNYNGIYYYELFKYTLSKIQQLGVITQTQ